MYFSCREQVCKNTKIIVIFEQFSLDETPEGLNNYEFIFLFSKPFFDILKRRGFTPKKMLDQNC